MLASRIKGIFLGGSLGQCSRLQKIILISLLATSLLSFVVSLRDIKQYGGNDLRNKVVGARYLLAGLDPYAIEWSPPKEWFVDPLRRYPGVSRTTVTPLVLMVYCPFAWLPYSTQRMIWFFIEWLTIILCILVLMNIVRVGMSRFVFLVFALFFFVSGYFWRSHVETGQFYIFLTFILSLAIFFDMKQKSFISAILLGLLAIFRPTFFIIVPLLLLLRGWKIAGTMVLASVAIFTLSLIGSNIQIWDSYVKNIFLIQRVVIDKEYSKTKFGLGNKVSGSVFEGANFSDALPNTGVPISSLVVIKQIAKVVPNISPAIILQLNKFAGAAVIIYCFIVSFLIRKYSFNKKFIWIFIVAAILNLDYFTPLRLQYVDIMFLPVIALAAPLIISPFVSIYFPIVVTSAFLLGHNRTLTLFGFSINNVLRSFLFMTALNTLIICCVYKKIKRSRVSSEKGKVKH